MKEYISIIKKAIQKDSRFDEAAEIARENCLGEKIWVVGGFLYKNIIMGRYGVELSIGDYDFILEGEKSFENLWVPKGWELKKTFFGAPKFVGKDYEVDAYSIFDAQHRLSESEFSKMSLNEKIKAHLWCHLFDVHKMAYGLDEERMYDEGGIEAIEKGEMRINDMESCVRIAQKKRDEFERLC